MEVYAYCYNCPLGELTLKSDGKALLGLSFGASPEVGSRLPEPPIFGQAKRWLDIYFGGKAPGFSLPLSLNVSEFSRSVLEFVLKVPFGKVVTYQEVARAIAGQKGDGRAARAVGQALARNPILIFIPCHRVVGAGGKALGYAGGVRAKERLLALERASSLEP